MRRHVLYTIAFTGLSVGLIQPSFGDDLPTMQLGPSASDIWVNFGGFSQHFKHSSRFNQDNFGFGLEYELDPDKSLVIGEYRNSVRRSTHYIGGAWTPLEVGYFRLGALAGLADGYPKMNKSGFFPLILPLVTFETKYVGANFTLMPSVASKVSGCIAVQLKFRFQ